MSKQPPPEVQPPVLMNPALPLSGKVLIEFMQGVHAKGCLFRFTAGGHSMAPFIKDGDVVSVSPLFARLPIPGEVVAFLHPKTKGLCLHRVLSVHKSTCFLQGDNVPGDPDGMIPREAIMGRVTRVERGGRRVRLGLGPERRLIAMLSRYGLLTMIRRRAGPLYACFQRRQRPCAKG